MLEHGFYELGGGLGERALAWYLFILASGGRTLLIVWGARRLASLEALFRNAR